uniref:C-type lectin domain-containing protein n=1 Tax=Panagrolaimus davidi TaxID=227884 RepID=A0A914QGK5_9BILA
MKLTLFIFFTFVPLLIKACPNGSIPFFTDPTLCFSFQTEKTNFIGAEEICIGLGGHLASVHSMYENVFVSEEAALTFTKSESDDFWIGANNFVALGNWTWMDGTPFDFKDWDKGQPQNTSNTNCASSANNYGQWKADECVELKPFVCLIKISPLATTVKPKSCPTEWTLFQEHCYKVFDNSNWIEAERKCINESAHLVSIHGLEEDQFVADLANFTSVVPCTYTDSSWIGAYTEDNNKNWKWTDGTPFDYEKWMPTQPDRPGLDDCLVIHLGNCEKRLPARTGDYDNVPCDSNIKKFVCKKLST